MDPQRFQPFLYWCHHHRELETGSLDSDGQRHCYTLWGVVEGTLTLVQDGKRAQVRPRQGAVMDPGVVAQWRGACRFFRLCCDLQARPRRRQGRDWRPVHWRPQPPLAAVFGCAVTGRVADERCPALLNLLQTVSAFCWRSAGEQVRCALQVAQWLLDHAQATASPHFDPWALPATASLADRAEAIIEHRFPQGLGIGAVAEQLGVSREHLARRYRAERGHPPQVFLRRCRLREAQRLLRDGDTPLAEVAARSGYGSAEALRRHFAEELGCTPGLWRERQRAPPPSAVDERPRAPIWE